MLHREDFLDDNATGDAIVPIHRTYRLDDIAAAYSDMEAWRATGKLVVLPRHQPARISATAFEPGIPG